MNKKETVREEKTPLMEEREMNLLIDFEEDAFAEGKLSFVQPESWKNVGISVVHAIKLMKDH